MYWHAVAHRWGLAVQQLGKYAVVINSMGLMSVLLTFVTVFILATRVNGQGLDGVARVPIEFSEIWLIYDMANAAKWPAMTLNDGTLTTAINDVITGSVAESKQQASSSWARFKLSESGAQLVARFPDWKAARPYFISDKSIAIGDDFVLSGCFSIGKTNQKYNQTDTSVVSATLCFSPTGVFTTIGVQLNQRENLFEESFAVNVQRGVYHINDNLITFEYAEGSHLSTMIGAYRFGQQAPALSAISVGEQILFKLPYGEFVDS